MSADDASQRLTAEGVTISAPGRRLAEWLTDGSAHSAVRRAAGIAFAIRLTSAAILYVSQLLLARWMGQFQFGIYVYVWSWIGLVGMAAPLGISYSAQRFIPQYRSRGDLDGLRGFVRGARIICIALGVAAGSLIAAIIFALKIPAYYLAPFLLASLTVPIFTVCAAQDLLGRAFNSIGIALVPGFILHPLLVLAILGCLVVLFGGITAAQTLAVAAGVLIVVAVLQWGLLARRIGKDIAPGPRRYEPLFWFKTALPLFLVDGFFLLLSYVDTLILQLFVGPSEVALYYAATKTLALVNFIYFAVGVACAHHFSEYYATGQRDRLARFVTNATRLTFWPSLALIAAMLALGRPVLALFGPGFTEAYPLIFIMAVGLLARASVGPAERLLSMVGEQNACAAVYCAAFVVNLGLCVLLVPRMGLFGAAIATATAVVSELVLLFIVANRRLDLDVFVWNGFAGR